VEPVTKKLLPLAAMEKILKNAGAARVSDGAKNALKAAVEERAEQLSARAFNLMKHAGRVTVKKDDIVLASK